MGDFESLFWIVLLVGIGIRYVITTGRFSELRRVVDQQGHEIAALKRAMAEARAPAPVPAAEPQSATASILPPVIEHEHIPIAPPPEAAPEPSRPATEPPREKIKPKQIEQQFGGRAFVWVGGVALALAGFYLVKYSIDTGLLTEQVRVILGVLFGIALLGGSHFVRARGEHVANGVRIGQALAGAGIADLYGSLFAATTLYHLVPPWLGFGAMAATTAAALILSLRHGAPIALLGLIGGYATPAMIEGEPNAPLLFSYLYLVFVGLTGITRGKNWWWLSLPATLVAFAWVVLWLTSAGASQDAAWLSTFLLAIGATAVIASPRRPEAEAVDLAIPRTWTRFLTPGGAIVLAGVVAYTTDFGLFEWGMFALFSLGAIGLAAFDGRTYFAIPWLAMVVNLAMLIGWSAEPSLFAAILTAFGLLFCTSGQLLLNRSPYPVSWAGLSATAALLYFLLAYGELSSPLATYLAGNTWSTVSVTWTAVAFALAAIMTWAAARPFVVNSEVQLRHQLQAIFAVAATSLISVGLAILLHEEYLSFAIATQIFAISWIRTRVDVPALRYLSYVLTAQIALLLFPDAVRLLAEALGAGPNTALGPWSLTSRSLFRFGLPAILFAGAARVLRHQKDDTYTTVLEYGAVALLTITLYKLIEAIFLGHAHDLTLVIGSIFTNILLALGIAVMRAARQWCIERLFWAGVSLILLAIVRIVVLDFLVFDPLWAHQTVGTLPLLNGLLPIFVLPAFLLYAAGWELSQRKILYATLAVRIAAYLLSFLWLSLSVRQIFNGDYLDSGTIGNAEVYAYSAVWLAVGVALLFAAAARKDMTMRLASLVVMLLTVGKVFLFDASQLTGLWRVVSFLGLGLSLLALSWFYSRFIFTTEKPEATA